MEKVFLFLKESSPNNKFWTRMIKNHKRQHTGRSHTQEKSQGLKLLWSMQLLMLTVPSSETETSSLHICEELGGVHVQEAAHCHQEGRESHEVLARKVVHTMGPFQGKNRINEEIV
jgi:hypothetical protein